MNIRKYTASTFAIACALSIAPLCAGKFEGKTADDLVCRWAPLLDYVLSPQELITHLNELPRNDIDAELTKLNDIDAQRSLVELYKQQGPEWLEDVRRDLCAVITILDTNWLNIQDNVSGAVKKGVACALAWWRKETLPQPDESLRKRLLYEYSAIMEAQGKAYIHPEGWKPYTDAERFEALALSHLKNNNDLALDAYSELPNFKKEQLAPEGRANFTRNLQALSPKVLGDQRACAQAILDKLEVAEKAKPANEQRSCAEYINYYKEIVAMYDAVLKQKSGANPVNPTPPTQPTTPQDPVPVPTATLFKKLGCGAAAVVIAGTCYFLYKTYGSCTKSGDLDDNQSQESIFNVDSSDEVTVSSKDADTSSNQ